MEETHHHTRRVRSLHTSRGSDKPQQHRRSRNPGKGAAAAGRVADADGGRVAGQSG